MVPRRKCFELNPRSIRTQKRLKQKALRRFRRAFFVLAVGRVSRFAAIVARQGLYNRVMHPTLPLWILVVLLFSAPTFAQKYKISQEDCPSVDLSEKFGELRDQGGASQCYAFVVADLVGYNQKVPPDEQVSALDVGISYNTASEADLYKEAHSFPSDNWDLSKALSLKAIPEYIEKRKARGYVNLANDFDQGGSMTLALAAYNKKGSYCSEKKLRSEAPYADRDRAEFINNRVRQLQSMGYGGMYMASLPVAPSDQPFIQTCRTTPDSLADFKPFGEQFREKVISQIREETDKQCSPRKTMKKMEYDYEGFARSPDSHFAFVATKLLQRRIPVGIGYDSNFLIKGRTAEVADAGHGSTLVGSRWNSDTKMCEFKLRNSWGHSCKEYAAEFRKDCEKENGYIWINENDLNTRADTIVAIKNQD